MCLPGLSRTIYVHFPCLSRNFNRVDIEQVRFSYNTEYVTQFIIILNNRSNRVWRWTMITYVNAKNTYMGQKCGNHLVYFPWLSRICMHPVIQTFLSLYCIANEPTLGNLCQLFSLHKLQVHLPCLLQSGHMLHPSPGIHLQDFNSNSRFPSYTLCMQFFQYHQPSRSNQPQQQLQRQTFPPLLRDNIMIANKNTITEI